MAPEGSRIFAPGLLAGSVCVVSGSGAETGREIALELARLGSTVVACAGGAQPLEMTVAAAAPLAGEVEAAVADIRDEVEVEALFAGLLKRHGRVDLLVNNAGGESPAPGGEEGDDRLRGAVELQVLGTWLMTHAAATKAFIPQGAGKVVSTVLRPGAAGGGSEVPGAAVENMMRTLSIEWARFGIRTCAIAAAPTAAREIAWMTAYLASPAGDFYSGATLTLA